MLASTVPSNSLEVFKHVVKLFFCGNSKKLTQPMDPEKKSLNFIFPTKYVIPKSLKFSHWLSEKT